MSKRHKGNTKAAAYIVDTEPGNHHYAFVEGVGECRANFMRMVEGIDRGEVDVVVVADAKLLFIDTSPLWMEKFIATVKRHRLLVVDATHQRNYDFRKSEDEATLRALAKK